MLAPLLYGVSIKNEHPIAALAEETHITKAHAYLTA